MVLFLFEFKSRELHGVFQACSDGELNIEPDAFRSSGKLFPAQVKFTEMWRCRPLPESEFRHAIRENYFTATKFKFGLSKAQVQTLLKLFSFKKEDRSFLRSERNLRNTVGERSCGNRYAGETNGDVDGEIPFRVTSTGDDRGRRLTENYGFGDEFNIGLEYDPTKGNEYSGDTSEVNMNNSFGRDDLTTNSYYSLVNGRRVQRNLRHTSSDWLENDYNEKFGITQASSRSNCKERLKFEEDPVVPPQIIPLDLRYGMNTGYYDPCEPRIMGDATMTSSRHDLGAPNAELIGSASFTANSNYGLGEEFIRVGGYVRDALPSETVQPFADEHNGTNMNTSSPGLDYYIPMPTEHRGYQTNTGMCGVAGAESETESRYCHLRHSQLPGLLTSTEATENMRKFERLPYPNHRIFHSFAYPYSSRDLSPKDGRNTEILTYQHQEEFGDHVSYANDMVVRGSSSYPYFTHPSTSENGADWYPKNRTDNKVQAYQQHEEFGGDAFDSNNRVTQMKDRVNPAELERNGTRDSVFKRLGVSSKECDAEKDMYPDTESVDEVMVFLNGCHKHWMEQKKSNMSTFEDTGKPKKKTEKIHTAEVVDNDLMHPFTETTLDDLVDCEESMEHGGQKLPFINFKRRSKAQKSLGNPTQGCKESPEHSASQNKKRKLLRPKLFENDSEKDRGNNENSNKIVFASEKNSGNNADPIVKFLASQSATEVHVHDFLGCNEGNSQKNREKNDDSIENSLASHSETKPVHNFLGRNEGDSEKDRGNDDNPVKKTFASEKDRGNNTDPVVKFLASKSATEVPVHDFLGCNEGNSQKNRGKNDDSTENSVASQSATEVPVHDFHGNEVDSEKNRGNNDNPIKIVFASVKDSGNNTDPIVKFLSSQSVTEVVPVHDFLGRNEGKSPKNRGKNDDSSEILPASQSAIEVPVHDFVGRNEGDSEKDKGKNDDPIENFLASQSAVKVDVHKLLGRDENDSEKHRGNNGDPMENVLASQSMTEVPFHDFLGRDDQ